MNKIIVGNSSHSYHHLFGFNVLEYLSTALQTCTVVGIRRTKRLKKKVVKYFAKGESLPYTLFPYSLKAVYNKRMKK